MGPKKTLKNLPRKGVSPRKSAAIKGGGKPKVEGPRISLNHNETSL